MNKKQNRILGKRQNELEKARKKEEEKAKREVRKMNAYSFDINNANEYDAHMQSLMKKYENSEKLSDREVEDLCKAIKPDLKQGYSICDDYRFYELYLDELTLKRNFNFASKYTSDEILSIMQMNFSPDANTRREEALNSFFEKWKERIFDEKQSNDKIYMKIRQEAKDMIRDMTKVETSNGATDDTIRQKEKEIILRSKTIYVKSKN